MLKTRPHALELRYLSTENYLTLLAGGWFKKTPKHPYIVLNGSLPVKSDDGHRMIPGIDRNRAAGASWRAAKAKNKVRNCLWGNISIKFTESKCEF